MAIKVTPSKRSKEKDVVSVKTQPTSKKAMSHSWWKGKSKKERTEQLLATISYLKQNQQYRFRQASIHARLYGNIPLFNFAGSTFGKMGNTNNLPVDRPTMNVVQSCTDTLVSRIAQAKPRPVFLTDAGNYRERKLAKQMNTFINGELYQTKAYELGAQILKDAAILGTGCIKVLEHDNRVCLERVLATELYVDINDAFYGKPRTIYQLKLVDRDVLREMDASYASVVDRAQQAYPDDSGDSSNTVSDQVMVVEAWHLPSGPNANDGKHVIACEAGSLLEESYDEQDFPFVFMHYSPRMVGFWSQGLAEQLTGTQVEINKLLITISQSINLVGVPRIFVEDGSKVVKAHLNNNIGSIVTYRGTKPSYEVAPCVPAELYQQLQRLVDYAYQQSGVSALSAAAQKPAGLNSGEAIRNYDDLQSDRFATIDKAYKQIYTDLVYKIIKKATKIAEETGKYSTVYPNKDGTKEIDLPASDMLKDTFVIQCFESSSLPRDPAGRMQKVVEMMQASIIDAAEGRRLLDFPDLQQSEQLANAAKERIYQMLDAIVEDGAYTPPDSYTNLEMAKLIVVQYYNLYAAAKLPKKQLAMLRDWQSQVLLLEQASMPPAPMGIPMDPNAVGPAGAGTQAVPEAQPTSSLLPQV